MSRPDVDFPLQYPSPDDPNSIVRSIQELSSHPIHRAYWDVKTKTAAYTMDPVLDRVIIASGTTTITLPNATEADHVAYTVKRVDAANTITVKAVGGTIDGTAAGTGKTITTNFLSITVVSDGTNWHIIRSV